MQKMHLRLHDICEGLQKDAFVMALNYSSSNDSRLFKCQFACVNASPVAS